MRKQARGVLVAAAALLAYPLGGAFADEAPKLAARLDEAPFAPLMDQGFAAAKAGKPADALAIFTGIDEKFAAAYAAGPRVYCSHNARETVINMTSAAADSQNAISIGGTWCDAIYLKAYSLIDLGRPAEAASELDRALKMSPDNPQYLNERAELLMRARHLDEALADVQAGGARSRLHDLRRLRARHAIAVVSRDWFRPNRAGKTRRVGGELPSLPDARSQ